MFLNGLLKEIEVLLHSKDLNSVAIMSSSWHPLIDHLQKVGIHAYQLRKNIITDARATKDETEIENMKSVQLRAEELVEYVANTKGAIGYVSTDPKNDKIKIITIAAD